MPKLLRELLLLLAWAAGVIVIFALVIAALMWRYSGGIPPNHARALAPELDGALANDSMSEVEMARLKHGFF